MNKRGLIMILIFTFLAGVGQAQETSRPNGPMPAKKPHKLTIHGDQRIDPYYWLKERDNPQVRTHLDAENAHTATMLKTGQALEKKLLEEFKSRIEKIEQSAPFNKRGHVYYTRILAGQDYPAYYRRKGSMQGPEELILDVNVLAKGQKFCSVPGVEISPDDQYLAYAVDNQGRRFYTIHVVELLTRKPVLTIEKTTSNLVWAEDGKTLFFSKQDPVTLRSFQIFRRRVDQRANQLIYTEKDTTFRVGVGKSRSDKYIFIRSGNTLSDEWHFLPAAKPAAKLRIFHPRQRGLEYTIQDGGDRFYILSNLNAKNFQVFECGLDKTSKEAWRAVLPTAPDVFRVNIDVFDKHLVVTERTKGTDALRVIDRKTKRINTITFPDEVYVVSGYVNAQYHTPVYLYSYQSLVTPPTVYAYRFDNGHQEIIHRKNIPGGFDSNLYTTTRVVAKARDGVEVPMSIVHRKGLIKNGSNPTLILGYGSYGYTVQPYFRQTVVSLLDRGFVYAIANVRGGSLLGRSWYEDGKLLKKKNTFTDFIDCSQYLIDQKYTSPKHLYASGGSAGGLLIGAVANMRPDLYQGMLAGVPFVDVVTTMLDESVPLTTGEYDEWGDPRKKVYYDIMKSYSPYDNVKRQRYPNILVTTGLHDSQVQYWEPAKWVAKLREHNTGQTMILLHVNMSAGHGGASGRLASLKELAMEWAFLLSLEEIK